MSGSSDFANGWIDKRLGSAELRRITVLSCGIAYDSVPRHSDPEAMVEQLARFRGHVDRIAGWYGGEPRPAGASVHITWGYPQFDENPSRLALRAALELATLSTVELGISCAVDTGLVITSGPSSSRDQNLVGTVVQHVESMQRATPAACVLASDAVRKLTAATFDFGIANAPAPPGCWQVLKARNGWTRAPQNAVRLVGRASAMDALSRTWSAARRGHAQSFSISGEAGIGKSALLQHLKARVAEDGGKWIEVQCAPERNRARLSAFRDALQDLVPDLDADACVARCGMDSHDRDLIKNLLRQDCNKTKVDAGDAFAAPQGGLFAALGKLISSFSKVQPLLIAFEDLHWADDATIELIDVLRRRQESLGRVAIIGTWRSCELAAPPLCFDGPDLKLEKLSSAEISILLNSDVHGAALPIGLRRQIANRAEGNPLFAVELARLHAAADVPHCDILLEPGSLNGLLARRLDALNELKPLVQAAAALGLQFELSVLAEVLQMSQAQLIPGVDELVRRGCLAMEQGQYGTSYKFTHALIRDAAHASIIKSHRRDLHLRVAEALSRGSRGQYSPAVVAGHYAEAGDNRGAFLWWRKAGERAAALSFPRAAVEHFEQALAVHREDPSAGTILESVEVSRMLAIELAVLKGNGAPEVVETLEQCLALAPSGTDERFDALWALQACRLVRGEIGPALELGDQLVAEATDTAARERSLRAHRVQGLAKLLAGQLRDAFKHYQNVIDIYDPARHSALRFRHASDQGAIAYAQLSWAAAITSDVAASAQNAKAALHLAGRLKHPHTTAHVVCVLAARAQTLGDLNAASVLAHAGKTLGKQFEFPYWAAWADIILGWVEGKRGSQDGTALIENAMIAYQQTGALQALPYALLLLAEAALAVRNPQRALRAAEEGLSLAQDHELRLYAAELLRARVVAKRQLGATPREVWPLIAEAYVLAEEQGAHTFSGRAARMWDDLCAPENRRPKSNLSGNCADWARGLHPRKTAIQGAR